MFHPSDLQSSHLRRDERDGQVGGELALLDLEELAEEAVHVGGQVVRPGAHVRRDELGDGGRVRVGEVQHGHATLVAHGLQVFCTHKRLRR